MNRSPTSEQTFWAVTSNKSEPDRAKAIVVNWLSPAGERHASYCLPELKIAIATPIRGSVFHDISKSLHKIFNSNSCVNLETSGEITIHAIKNILINRANDQLAYALSSSHPPYNQFQNDYSICLGCNRK